MSKESTRQCISDQIYSQGQRRSLDVWAVWAMMRYMFSLPFHLRPVGSKAVYGLARVGERHPIDRRPHVSQASGAELDARGDAKLRVARLRGEGGEVEADE